MEAGFTAVTRKYQHLSCLHDAYLAPTGESSPDAVWGEHNVRPYFGTDHIGSWKRELRIRKFGQKHEAVCRIMQASHSFSADFGSNHRVSHMAAKMYTAYL